MIQLHFHSFSKNSITAELCHCVCFDSNCSFSFTGKNIYTLINLYYFADTHQTAKSPLQ